MKSNTKSSKKTICRTKYIEVKIDFSKVWFILKPDTEKASGMRNFWKHSRKYRTFICFKCWRTAGILSIRNSLRYLLDLVL